jgi:MPBQ/MSBQ methyltransferase
LRNSALSRPAPATGLTPLSWRRLLDPPAVERSERTLRPLASYDRSRFRQPEDRRSPRAVKTDATLRFFHEVLGLDYLHYGLWDAEDPLDIAGLHTAQRRYSERLITLVPEGVQTVLDVGSGTARMSQALQERGFAVEGLSPDPYQADRYLERVGAPFHLGRFQEFWPDRAYDLVLMSESSQYVWLESLFPAVLRAGAGGFLLVADYFTVAPGGAGIAVSERSGHPLEAFLAAAERHGLALEHRQDVTARVLPTLVLARTWLDRYVAPTVAIARDSLGRRSRLLLWIARVALRRRLERLERTSQLLDPEAFARCKRYEILRFKVPAA